LLIIELINIECGCVLVHHQGRESVSCCLRRWFVGARTVERKPEAAAPLNTQHTFHSTRFANGQHVWAPSCAEGEARTNLSHSAATKPQKKWHWWSSMIESPYFNDWLVLVFKVGVLSGVLSGVIDLEERCWSSLGRLKCFSENPHKHCVVMFLHFSAEYNANKCYKFVKIMCSTRKHTWRFCLDVEAEFRFDALDAFKTMRVCLRKEIWNWLDDYSIKDGVVFLCDIVWVMNSDNLGIQRRPAIETDHRHDFNFDKKNQRKMRLLAAQRRIEKEITIEIAITTLPQRNVLSLTK
jgi:hypothetical protein